ncbi:MULTISPECIES: CAP domain-containing protein [unclassified Bacillus cereus group]|uniref:CAP domain-containing protein n=1 Tax=unclassified Bacillus cereus group TaxID=2750818 RepID=UPI001F59E9A5|nr:MULTISPECIES: CAP domain-containing protein [unclassified Bacillus cereus group]
MKKRILLSVAAATALTLGVTSLDAQAATVQPAKIKIQNIQHSKIMMKYMNQQELQAYLQSIGIQSLAEWNQVLFQQDCFISNKQPVPITPETQKPTVNNETAKPEAQKPTVNNETAKPEAQKPAVNNETAKPEAQKPTVNNETAKPEAQKPAVNNETAKPEAQKPAVNNETQKPAENKPAEEKKGSLSEFEQRVVELTNAERTKQGLSALQVDNELSKVARAKSEDMQKNNYFDHNSPTYGSPFDMMKRFGISYKSAGENIAQGQRTPEEVVQAWMNSEGHRANILNSNFTHIGVGHIENGNYWTQQFITK